MHDEHDENAGCQEESPRFAVPLRVRDEKQKSKRDPSCPAVSAYASIGTAIGTATTSRWPNEVIITKIDNGFIVRVGCKTLVGKDWHEVSNGLNLYWIDPEAAEKLYLKK